jgi:glycosyltransferase involved in cell wall biosynthesis
MRVLVHAPGPVEHGVVRHARVVAGLAARHGALPVEHGADLTHAQFTDSLYPTDVAAAADTFLAWSRDAPRPLVTTLHDVPGSDPDPARDRRRVAGYARVAAACDAVVVSARHEAAKVAKFGVRAEVIGLPVERWPDGGAAPTWTDRPTVGVLGFVYPGKGHAEAIDAAARLPRPPRVVAIGAASPGHDGMLRDLRALAVRRGVDLVVTGSLSAADLAAAARAATVALVGNARVSASGSLAAWLGCGRRPVVARGEYAAEVARSHPGALHPYDDDSELDALLGAALADPTLTWLDGEQVWPDAGRAHAALYRRLLGQPC